LRNRLIIVEKNVINTSKSGETPVTNDREWTFHVFIYIFLLNGFRLGLKGTQLNFCMDHRIENWCLF
jgi:hypothetical protein